MKEKEEKKHVGDANQISFFLTDTKEGIITRSGCAGGGGGWEGGQGQASNRVVECERRHHDGYLQQGQ